MVRLRFAPSLLLLGACAKTPAGTDTTSMRTAAATSAVSAADRQITGMPETDSEQPAEPKQVQMGDGTGLSIYSDHVEAHSGDGTSQAAVLTKKNTSVNAVAPAEAAAPAPGSGATAPAATDAASGGADPESNGTQPKPTLADDPVPAEQAAAEGRQATLPPSSPQGSDDGEAESLASSPAASPSISPLPAPAPASTPAPEPGTNDTPVGFDALGSVPLTPNTTYDVSLVNGAGAPSTTGSVTTLAAVPAIETASASAGRVVHLVIDERGNPAGTQYSVAVLPAIGGGPLAYADLATGIFPADEAHRWGVLPPPSASGVVELVLTGISWELEEVVFAIRARNSEGEMTAWSDPAPVVLPKDEGEADSTLDTEDPADSPDSPQVPGGSQDQTPAESGPETAPAADDDDLTPPAVASDRSAGIAALRADIAALRHDLQQLLSELKAARKSRQEDLVDRQAMQKTIRKLSKQPLKNRAAVDDERGELASVQADLTGLARTTDGLKKDIAEARSTLKGKRAELKALLQAAGKSLGAHDGSKKAARAAVKAQQAAAKKEAKEAKRIEKAADKQAKEAAKEAEKTAKEAEKTAKEAEKTAKEAENAKEAEKAAEKQAADEAKVADKAAKQAKKEADKQAKKAKQAEKRGDD